MSEVLLIPECDTITDFGIPNYHFLRSLNKEFHEIWNGMFSSTDGVIFPNNKEIILYWKTQEYCGMVHLFHILILIRKHYLETPDIYY